MSSLLLLLFVDHDWIDQLNASSTAVIALFTVLLFIGVVYQIKTDREIERAWVLAELGWYEGGLHIANNDSIVKGGEQLSTTSLNIKLTCKNDGNSPAWIEDIFGRADIFGTVKELNPNSPGVGQLQSLGDLEPLGPGIERSRVLQMECEGRMGKDDRVSVFVLIRYRDIFGKRRTTSLGYTVLSGKEIGRQNALSKRNQNT